jgi:endonuclease YncB( thermonuclease family)
MSYPRFNEGRYHDRGGRVMPMSTVWTYPRATVLYVHDGDTLAADLDLGFGLKLRQLLRLEGCNAIELSQPGGVEARDNLAALLPVGAVVPVTVVSLDKFAGRADAQITLPDGRDLVIVLIAGQWAAPWGGLGPKPSPPWPREIPA